MEEKIDHQATHQSHNNTGPAISILHANGIYVDEFSKKDNGYEHGILYFLTQSHLDHRKSSLKRFRQTIYCSNLTKKLIKAPNIIVLKPNQWYHLNGIDVFVAETLHCPGSLMFYFKNFEILHFGDSRVDLKILNLIKSLSPKTILYDNLFSELHGFIPSIESSAAMLQNVFLQFQQHKKKVNFCLCHTGTLLLLQILKQKVCVDIKNEPLKQDVLFLLEEMDLIDQESNILGVSLQSKDIDIVVSSQYFIIHKVNPNQIIHDSSNGKDIIRVFVSFHSCANDLALLKGYSLESLHYD